jgi:hypothetical protein
MKKITLLFVVIIAITASFAATTRWFWYGDTPQIATTQYWDMGTTANWYDPSTIDPLTISFQVKLQYLMNQR